MVAQPMTALKVLLSSFIQGNVASSENSSLFCPLWWRYHLQTHQSFAPQEYPTFSSCDATPLPLPLPRNLHSTSRHVWYSGLPTHIFHQGRVLCKSWWCGLRKSAVLHVTWVELGCEHSFWFLFTIHETGEKLTLTSVSSAQMGQFHQLVTWLLLLLLERL